jgi:hypothetical protein
MATENLNNPRTEMQQTISKTAVPRNGAINSVQKADFPVHGWYRFVLSYPPHFVLQYMGEFGIKATDLMGPESERSAPAAPV